VRARSRHRSPPAKEYCPSSPTVVRQKPKDNLHVRNDAMQKRNNLRDSCMTAIATIFWSYAAVVGPRAQRYNRGLRIIERNRGR
jgi:hypothetical protein